MRSAVLLAAGAGTRIFPYQETRQKAAIPVGNRPIISRVVECLRTLGFSQMTVVVGHLKEQVFHALGEASDLAYLEQRPPAGTCSALLQAAQQITDDSFLVVSGDVATAPENLRLLRDRFLETGAEAAALLQPLGQEQPGDWLCASVSGGALTGVSGHPRDGSHRLAGIYALRQSALACLRRNPGIMRHVPVGGMPPLEAEVAESLAMMLEEGRQVLAVETVEFLVDVDKPWQVLEANLAAVRYDCSRLGQDIIAPSATVSPRAEVKGRLVVGEGSEIGPGVWIEGNLLVGKGSTITRGAMVGGDVMVGDGCRIGDFCQVGGGSVIGDGCVIGHGAEFWGVMFDRVYLYHYCEVSGLVGSAVDIGAATVCGTLRFDDQRTVHKVKGRREAPPSGANECYIGDYCRTGVNAILMPGVKIGPYSVVGPGVIVYQDVPARTLLLAKQELVQKPWGPEKYGW